MTDPRPLTEKQRRFVDAFTGPAQGNATKAAKLAGYAGSDAVLAVKGAEAVRNGKVQAAIAAATAAVRSKAVASREERQAHLSAILRGEARIKELDPTGTEVSVPPTWNAVLKAHELLGKMQGDFTEKHEHEVRGASVSFVFESNGRGPAPT